MKYSKVKNDAKMTKDEYEKEEEEGEDEENHEIITISDW